MPNKKQAPKIEPEVSSCCKADMSVYGDGFSTAFYFCNNCKQATDPYIAPKKRGHEELFSHRNGYCNCKKKRVVLLILHYSLFILLGILLTLAYFKLRYVIHTSTLGDLILLKK